VDWHLNKAKQRLFFGSSIQRLLVGIVPPFFAHLVVASLPKPFECAHTHLFFGDQEIKRNSCLSSLLTLLSLLQEIALARQLETSHQTLWACQLWGHQSLAEARRAFGSVVSTT
jgi:hypothetical protein